MLRWLALRLVLATVTLLGITFVTFCAMDLASVDRAALELARRTEEPGAPDLSMLDRDIALAKLRIRHGLVDPMTLRPKPVHERYATWLSNAATLRFCGPGDDPAEFRARIARALPVSLLLGALSLGVALLIGVPLGAFLGMRTGQCGERWIGGVLLAMAAMPDALFATIALMLFAGPVFDWLPAGGLDRASSYALPVFVMALGPIVLLSRFLRESVARVAASPFADNLVAWGTPPRERSRRILRVALAPVATLAGSLLPMLVAGSVVVETTFAIDGMGRLLLEAVRSNDCAMAMVATTITAAVTLVGFVASDLLHRALDPRVRLRA